MSMAGSYWVWCILLGFFLQAYVLQSQNSTCHPDDLKALQGFLAGLKSGLPGWTSNGSDDCCSWDGVHCEGSARRVVSLKLVDRSLRGSISESLSGLGQLRVLNLSLNFLKGNLPSKLLQLKNLQVLDLSFNSLNGPIRSNSSLPSLQVFNISGNYFSGQFPLLTNSPLLTSFVVQGNRFSGGIDGAICLRSPEIALLQLSDNNFSGNLPAGIENCTNIRHLDLDSNALVGNLPDELFRMSSLKRLSLQDNMLSGYLSEKIGNLSNLEVLDLSFNGFIGIIPDVFDRLKRLKHFCSVSTGFSGHLPASISKVSTLQLLNLRNNSLKGEIDLKCTTMVGLTSLDLGSNQFSGHNLDKLSLCRELRTLNLARNRLDGLLPESFKELQHLSYLSLTCSGLRNLSSALMVLQQCKNLTTLVLTGNFRDEVMPMGGIIGFKRIKVLIVPNCQLSGFMPSWLSSCRSLQLLDLSWNRLEGAIPNWIGNLDNLFYLDLSNNSLSGKIPRSLTQLKSLISRNISQEDLPSDVPFFAKQNQSTRGLQYKQVINFRPTLDLCDNNFSGSIWPEFGNLKKLHVLDLSRNHLSGSIPDQLSGMMSIEVLDLSFNELSGKIPVSLTNLSFLSRFDVSHNQLSGSIPTAGQFSTFSNSSYEGNSGLLVPCPHCPSESENPQQKKKSVKSRKATIIGMTMGIGLGTMILLLLVFLYVSRLHVRTADDTERDGEDSEKRGDLELSGSRLVLLFHNKGNKEITVDDLLKSTNNFDQANIIGCGGFGLVYKATLPDGRRVAVKRLSGDTGQMEREFQAEVDALSKAQHKNLVLLQGYCRFGSDRLLIYSYMEKGSLDYWLHEKVDGGSTIDWAKRVHIAQGAAKGLAYLHQSCQPHILHRDIKSSNILLDENFEAHLADFGLARLILPYDTHVTTDLVGTLGYIPPEYGQASIATFKGDVYSFGVVLLELLTGKRPMDMCRPKGFRDLISWVLQMKKEKRENEVFDPVIYDKEHEKQMLQVLEIACLCLNESPKLRPSVQQIVLWLDNVGVDA